MNNLDLTDDQLAGRAPIAGDLNLNHLEELSPDFAPVVRGDLFLDGLRSLPPGFAPKVGGDLWLRGLEELPEGFTPVVGGTLWLPRITELPADFAPVVGGVVWTPRLNAKKIEPGATYLVTERKWGSVFTESYITSNIYSFVEQQNDYDLEKDYFFDELESLIEDGSDVHIYEIDDEEAIYDALALAHILRGPAEEIFTRLEKKFGETK